MQEENDNDLAAAAPLPEAAEATVFLQRKGPHGWEITSVYTDIAKVRKIERAANA